MKGTLRYLAGMAGPSGFGSNSTAEQVTEDSSCFLPSSLTALITGKSQKQLPETTMVVKITMKINLNYHLQLPLIFIYIYIYIYIYTPFCIFFPYLVFVGLC